MKKIVNISEEHVVMKKRDSAVSDHYWKEQDAHVLSDIQDSLGPSVLIPNGATIASTK